MFNPEERKERIGDLKETSELNPLREVEQYFFDVMEGYPTDYVHDCTAYENPFFETMCYTSYANCFMMHPLQHEMKYRQVQEARGVGTERDFAGMFEAKLISGKANKYEGREKVDKQVETLVVLPGSNKLKLHVCPKKLLKIKDEYPRVGFKPHPVTEDKVIKDVEDELGIKCLPKHSDLYNYLINCSTVFTTHMSESAAYASAIGKRIEPIDKYELRLQESFSHINAFLFLEANPRAWINRTFSDYRSGILHPVLEPNWKEKMVAYLDFIHDEREKFRYAYL